MTQRPDGAQTIGEILAAARARLARLTPAEAFEEFCAGATLIDIRPAWQRAAADAAVLLREKRLPEPQRLVLQQELVRVQAVLAGIRSQPAPACPAAAER